MRRNGGRRRRKAQRPTSSGAGHGEGHSRAGGGPGRRAAQRLRRDRVLAAASPDRRRTASRPIEFTVPDSVTSWNVWVHAVTRDLQAGSLHTEAKSVKDLMVRPYLPRFLREGDQAEIKVVVNNASEKELSGRAHLRDPRPRDQREEPARRFGLDAGATRRARSREAAGGGTNLSFAVTAPHRGRPGGVQGRRRLRRPLRRRAAAAADAPRPHAPGAVALRDAAATQTAAPCASTTWRRTTTPRASTSRWS